MILPNGKLPVQTVAGFRYQPRDRMSTWCESLGLSMLPGEVTLLQSVYRSENRDPSYEEIAFFDRFLTYRATLPGTRVFTTVDFEDATVADVWQDFVARRSKLRPEAKAPVGYDDVLAILTDDLYRAGKSKTLADGTVPLSLPGSAPLTEKPIRVLRDRRFVCTVVKETSLPFDPQTGDVLMLLFPSLGMENDLFLEQTRVRERLHALKVITPEGLAACLIRHFGETGCRMSLDFLTGGEGRADLAAFAEPFAGYVLLTLPSNDADTVKKIASESRVRLATVGEVTNDRKLTLIGRERTPLSFSFANLHRLLVAYIDSPSIGPEEETVSSLRVETLRGPEEPLIRTKTPEPVLTASVEFDGAGYRHAIEATLLTVLDLVAKGADPQKLLVSLAAEHPTAKDHASAGKCLASRLGIYRVLAELAIPTVHQTLGAGESPLFRITGTALPTPFAPKGRSCKEILLTPSILPDGSPDYEDIRSMLAWIHGQYQSKTVHGGYARHRIALSELTGAEEDAATTLPFAAVLYYDGNLEVLPAGCRVLENRSEDVHAIDVCPESPYRSALYEPHPRVLIAVGISDTDPRPLVDLCRHAGADVSVFFAATDADADRLSYEIRQAQIVLLLGNGKTWDTLLAMPRVVTALDILHTNDGLLVCLGESVDMTFASDLAPDPSFPGLLSGKDHRIMALREGLTLPLVASWIGIFGDFPRFSEKT